MSNSPVVWKCLPLCIVMSRKSTEVVLISCVNFMVGWCSFSCFRRVSSASLVSV